MKKEWTLFLIVLLAAGHVVAQQQTNAPSAPPVRTAFASQTNAPPVAAAIVAPKPKFHLFGPAKPVQPYQRLRLIEGLDPRAWTTVAETRTSRLAFPNGENHEAGLCLLWWGSQPQWQ